MNKKSMVDLVAVMIYSDGKKKNEEIIGITRIQKLIFLAINEGDLEKGIESNSFEPYKLGPINFNIYDIIEFLSSRNIIQVEEKNASSLAEQSDGIDLMDEEIINSPFTYDPEIPDGKGKVIIYKISNVGKKIIEEKILKKFSAQELDKIRKLKIKYNSVSLFRLLEHVYQTYPKFAEKSIIRDRFGV